MNNSTGKVIMKILIWRSERSDVIRRIFYQAWYFIFCVLLLNNGNLIAQEKTTGPGGAQELALKLSNPLASMISVPFQFNLNVGIGRYNGSQLITNFQPVIPFTVGKFNVITRTIVPFIENRDIVYDGTTTFGLSDINFSAFITPAKAGKILFGIGPAITFPTATASILGAKKWAAGPTMALMTQRNGWTYIVLARQIWSFAGNENVPNVSPYYINPGLGYSFKSGAGLGANLEIAGDWNNAGTQSFLNMSGSMVSKFGNQLVSFSLGPRIPLTSGTLGAWGMRAGFTLIFKQ